MKTMELLCRRFDRKFADYAADLDTINSYPGRYYVCIINVVSNDCWWHAFTSCRDFLHWMNGVILD